MMIKKKKKKKYREFFFFYFERFEFFWTNRKNDMYLKTNLNLLIFLLQKIKVQSDISSCIPRSEKNLAQEKETSCSQKRWKKKKSETFFFWLWKFSIFSKNHENRGVPIYGSIYPQMDAIVRSKPEAVKGTFLRSAYLTSSMGPSVPVDISSLQALKPPD